MKLMNLRPTIYHELGHIVGYCLADNFTDCKIAEIKLIELGLKSNFVIPKESFYHIKENMLDEMDFIHKSTKNVNRTIAWFIEVLLGCTFQTIVEKKPFQSCYKHGNYDGHIDFSNMATVRLVSDFFWSFDDIFKLENELRAIIIKEGIIEKLEPVVNNLLIRIEKMADHQLNLSENDISELMKEINFEISKTFVNDYKSLIDKYKLILTSEKKV